MDKLPDLFVLNDGRRVATKEQWSERRRELLQVLLELEYSPLPPIPTSVTAVELHHHFPVRRWHNAYRYHYRIAVEGGRYPFWFSLEILTPEQAGKYPQSGDYPVVINGDECWAYQTDEVRCEVLRRGYVLATFNRTEIVPDNYTMDRNTGLYLTYPEVPFRALGAWAWGYHRVVDFLRTQPYIDPERIAIVGHSRGGKATLLAGATDERIALTSANDSGFAGAGSHHCRGPKCEVVANGQSMVPYWYSPRLAEFTGRDDELPFDQHFLKALVAPRALLTTEALADLHANPTGTFKTHLAAREAYRFLDAESRIGIWYREGAHAHTLADWKAFLDFADWQFKGITPPQSYDVNPFAERTCSVQ